LFITSTRRFENARQATLSGPEAAPASSARHAVRCREIAQADCDAVVDLLTRGFDRSRSHWSRALQLLTRHATPEGFPKYGYLLENDGKPVGVLLLLFTSVMIGDERQIRCNVSSWYVEPEFRGYAAILSRRGTRHKNVCYFNISPAPHTWPMLKAEGYKPFASGRVIAFPAFCRSRSKARVSVVEPGAAADAGLTTGEIDILLDHAGYGCLSLVCESKGTKHPFVFRLHHRQYGFPVARLVYCRDLDEFVQFAAPLGKFLARRGYVVVTVNSNGPVSGLIGYYKGNAPKYSKGIPEMRLGDVAYSELGMFGA
jgi:hypothetical protein